MPIIKVYGFEEDTDECKELCAKIDQKMSNIPQLGVVGLVSIWSTCQTCEAETEEYQYLEVFYRTDDQRKRVIQALKELKLGLDVVLIKLLADDIIPDTEME